MLSPRADVGIGRLISILAPLAQSAVRAPEAEKPGDVDLRTGLVVCAQNGTPCGRLKSQVADGGGAIDSRERARERVVACEAASARAHIGEPARVEKSVSGNYFTYL